VELSLLAPYTSSPHDAWAQWQLDFYHTADFLVSLITVFAVEGLCHAFSVLIDIKPVVYSCRYVTPTGRMNGQGFDATPTSVYIEMESSVWVSVVLVWQLLL
jgi:hypothetical protein